MKTFKGVVFASIVFDVYFQINDVVKETQYPVVETKSADLHYEHFLLEQWLNNDWNVIISKAEKVQICGKTSMALPS